MAKMPVAGGFVFEPRTYAQSDKQFGKTASPLTPSERTSIDDPRFRAAAFQHFVANLVRELLLARRQTLHAYVEQLPAKTPGIGYDRLIRIQRGETMMQITDLFYWCGRFPEIADAVSRYSFGEVSSADGQDGLGG